MSPLSTLSRGIEPHTRAFLEKINSLKGPALYEMPVEEARKVFAGLQDVPVTKLPVDIEDRTVPVGPAGSVAIRITRPEGVKNKLPIVVYTHGAGWVFGDRDIYDRLVRDLTVGTGAALVFIDYSRSPEARYPVAIEEIYAATKYVSEQAAELNLDAERMVVAGDSVGGNMTAALTMMIKQRGGPKLKAQVLFYPVTDFDFENESYREFRTDHFLTQEAMKWFWNQYLPDQTKRSEPTASPLRATVEQLKGLPSALVINGEFDVLRDEGEAYAHKLIEAGVKVTAVRFHGTIHDFVMLNAITETPAARGAIAMASDFIRTALNS